MNNGLGLIELLSEINCRIDHGSNDNGHLNYVRYELERILYGAEAGERDIEKEIEERKIIHKTGHSIEF